MGNIVNENGEEITLRPEMNAVVEFHIKDQKWHVLPNAMSISNL